MKIEKYSVGIGDRFGHQGAAQLRALQMAEQHGVHVVPVWNKSNREHTIIGTEPNDARHEADAAVNALGWRSSYYVDADHIGLGTVDRFISSSNFFTIDVADFIGKPSTEDDVRPFIAAMRQYKGEVKVPGIDKPIRVDDNLIAAVAQQYLYAVTEAGKVYRHIAKAKGAEGFVAEVSFDEADAPQTPAELLFILAAISREGIPVQTIAPKFTGSFLKGIDYVGNIVTFEQEFEDDVAVVAYSAKQFNLPANLKLSVHSGSDKFSLYPIIHRVIKKFDAGLHLKTAGTTWLEEMIGLAEAGGEGLATAKKIYALAYARYDELCKPYLPVISIDRAKLPRPQQVQNWTSSEYVRALRHNQADAQYNLNFRQLIHVGYKVAAEMGSQYMTLLERFHDTINTNVTENIYSRHLLPLFVGEQKQD